MTNILELPTGPLVDASLALVRSTESQPIAEHSIRTFLFARLLAEHVPIVMDLHAGKSRACYWTCDFTAEYVRINASYRT